MKRWLTPVYLNFFFGAFLAIQIVLFLYLESTPGVLDRHGRVRGRDFLLIYVGARLVAEGRADILYHQPGFLAFQESIAAFTESNPPYLSVYPPHTAFYFSLLARLPYPQAIEVWWLIQLACVALTSILLIRELTPPPPWQWTAWLGVVAFYPVIDIFWNGQLAALLLLLLVVGRRLHQQHQYLLAGLVLSFISMKPQLALGLYVWLLLRWDWRTLLGVALGGLFHIGMVLALLGPETLIQFVNNSKLVNIWYVMYRVSDNHQHAFAGILTNLFGPSMNNPAMIIQGLIVLVSAFLLWRVIRSGPLQRKKYEVAAGIIFMLVSPPHLLTYDLSYLLIATVSLLVWLRDDPKLLYPILFMYGSATLAPLYVATHFSLVPLVLLATLGYLAWQAQQESNGVRAVSNS